MLPAHGHPFTDLAGRVKAIKQHHEERLERLRAASAEIGRSATVNELMQHLFSERSWGRMAESETYAHLEHLRLAGHADAHWEDGAAALLEVLTGADDRTVAGRRSTRTPPRRPARPARAGRRRTAPPPAPPRRPGSATAAPRPQRALGGADGVVGHEHGVVDERRRRGERHGADRAWRRASRRRGPLTATSTGDPARRASYIAGIGAGSTLTIVHPVAEPRRHAGDQPAAADGDQHGVESGRLPSSSRAIVPWPATTSGWSYGCTSRAPVSAARAVGGGLGVVVDRRRRR